MASVANVGERGARNERGTRSERDRVCERRPHPSMRLRSPRRVALERDAARDTVGNVGNAPSGASRLVMANADVIPVADEVLADKYRIERVLGQGGMGVVVAATHLQLEERVAIKFLLPELAHEPELVARFLREGRAAIKIRSEHVVRVLDVATLPGGHAVHGDGVPGGQELRRAPRAAGAAAGRGRRRSRAAGERGARRGARARHRPPRSQAGEPLPRAPGGRKPLREGARLRHLEGGRRQGARQPRRDERELVMGSPLYMSPEQMRSTRTSTRAPTSGRSASFSTSS